MDGKFKTFTLENLLESSPKQLTENHFVETAYGITDTEYFKLGPNEEFMVAGQDDGTVLVYDYSANKEKSYQKPVFRV